MDIKLGQLITTQQVTPLVAICMTNGFVPVHLPTEAVVTEPQFVVPRQARAYRTDLYIFEDAVVDYHALLRLRGDEFHGTVHERSVYLIEVWCDFGDDGHVSWSLIGWKFIESSVFDNADNRLDVVRETGADLDAHDAARRASLEK